jgi:hypothetical protein
MTSSYKFVLMFLVKNHCRLLSYVPETVLAIHSLNTHRAEIGDVFMMSPGQVENIRTEKQKEFTFSVNQ